MFDSLKSKMKGLFSKGKKLSEEQVYRTEEAEQPPAPPVPEKGPEATPAPAETEIPEVPRRTEEPVVAEPEVRQPEPEPVREEPKLSRKEMLKLKKQERKEGRKPSASADVPVGDSGKRIKEDPLDEILDELEIILLEADVAYPVVEEIKAGVRVNLIGR